MSYKNRTICNKESVANLFANNCYLEILIFANVIERQIEIIQKYLRSLKNLNGTAASWSDGILAVFIEKFINLLVDLSQFVFNEFMKSGYYLLNGT